MLTSARREPVRSHLFDIFAFHSGVKPVGQKPAEVRSSETRVMGGEGLPLLLQRRNDPSVPVNGSRDKRLYMAASVYVAILADGSLWKMELPE